jgi:hypothetical protein
MQREHHDAHDCREHAAEVRAKAETINDLETRRTLLDIAAEFELLATVLEADAQGHLQSSRSSGRTIPGREH